MTATRSAAGVSVEREFTKELKASLGVAFRYAVIKDSNEPEETFGLLSLPARIDWDFADDRFSPTRGGTLLVTGAPYHRPARPLAHLRQGPDHHDPLPPAAPRRPIWCWRCAARSARWSAPSRDEVPADERFYAGGGGSIRGIGYELAGPLDDDDKPAGRPLASSRAASSCAPASANNFGARAVPRRRHRRHQRAAELRGTRVLFGAGPGLRYFTPIGPVRVDLGFPLNPRQGVDDPFQLYFSLGQAF